MGSPIVADIREQMEVIRRGVVEIISEEELVEKLRRGKPLRIKAGFDPTAPDLHLGHTVLLQKLKQFQDLGHQVIFLIGDFTAMIGDPSGRNETRPALSAGDVKKNVRTYQEQVFKVLDPNKTQVKFNSEWLGPMSAMQFAELGAKQTVARMLERDDFKKRFKEEKDISLLEFYYPLIQAYDSVILDADVELGGTDQKFNLLMGRTVQRRYEKESQVVMTLPLLVGTDGVQKMSKSYGNYIGINEPASEIVGKVMSVSDELMWTYYELLSDLSSAKIQALREAVSRGTEHPKEAKQRLAVEIAARFQGKKAAEEAAREFENVFRNKGLPDDVECVRLCGEGGKKLVVDLLTELEMAPSKTEARRLIRQGAVTIDDRRITEIEFELESTGEHLLKVGKRRFKKVRFH